MDEVITAITLPLDVVERMLRVIDLIVPEQAIAPADFEAVEVARAEVLQIRAMIEGTPR